MSKWEISSCINSLIFDYSALIVDGKDRREALVNYIERLKDELNDVDIDEVLSDEDGSIWEVIDE